MILIWERVVAKLAELEKKLLHYTGKAIADFNMIAHGDRVMVCLSGGKDSFTMLRILSLLQKRANIIQHEILTRDTYSIVKEKLPEGKTYCSLCSRLRRGIIYRYAEENNYNKIALGHHRDDLIRSLLMSIFYNGNVSSMPPK